MQVYETTFIVNPQLEDAGIDQRVTEISDLIGSNGGKIVHTEHMGTRRLAYQIQNLTQGYYGSFVYEASEATPKILERHFLLNDAYLRYLTVRFEGDPARLKEKPEADEHRHGMGPSRPPVGARRPDRPPVKRAEVKTESVTPAEKPEAAAPTETPAPAPEAEKPTETPAPAPETEKPAPTPEPEKPADTEEPEQL